MEDVHFDKYIVQLGGPNYYVPPPIVGFVYVHSPFAKIRLVLNQNFEPPKTITNENTISINSMYSERAVAAHLPKIDI